MVDLEFWGWLCVWVVYARISDNFRVSGGFCLLRDFQALVVLWFGFGFYLIGLKFGCFGCSGFGFVGLCCFVEFGLEVCWVVIRQDFSRI